MLLGFTKGATAILRCIITIFIIGLAIMISTVESPIPQARGGPLDERYVRIPRGNTADAAYRLRTFQYLPRGLRVDFRALAAAGFYFTGYKDRVKCFSCHVCMYVENLNGWQDVASDSLHLDTCRLMRGEPCENRPLVDTSQHASTGCQFGVPSTSGQSPYTYSNSPCLRMSTTEARLQTFDYRWPRHRVNATPRELATAGFFFLGESDRVKCWYCNGGLQDWETTDEPWVEHAKWFPACPFLLRKRGRDFVSRIMLEFPNIQRPVASNLSINQNSLPNANSLRNVDQVDEIQLGNAMDTEVANLAIHMGYRRISVENIIRLRLGQCLPMYNNHLDLISDLVADEQCEAFFNNSDESEDFVNRDLVVEESETEEDISEELSNMQVVDAIENEIHSLRERLRLTEETNVQLNVRLRSSQEANIHLNDRLHLSEEANFQLNLRLRLRDETNHRLVTNVRSLQQTNRQLRERIRYIEERHCSICLDRQANTAFVPCGHFCACETCARALHFCPICRAEVERILRIFFS